MKKEEKRDLAHLVIEHNAQARITYELAHQLESHLPIMSVEQLTAKLDEVVVEKHRLPVKMFVPHITNDLFPIESIEDLVRKLSAGIRNALALAQSPSFPIRNPAVREILATTLQDEPGRRPATPLVFGGVGSSLNQLNKGGA